MNFLYSNRGRVVVLDADCVQLRGRALDLNCRFEGWAGAIAVGAAVAGTAATVVSANQSANAQKSAASSAAKSQQDANQTNLQEFEESRGSNGSAVLPLYLTSGPNGSGGLFENQLGQDLVSAYNDSAVPLSKFEDATAPYAASEKAAGDFTNDIFNGGITSKLLAEAQPVQQARISSAADALNKTLASIDAAQAGKGFTGDSYGNRLLQMQGRAAQGQAGVQNLAENQQIENYGDVSLPLNNLNLPSTMATQAGQVAFLPQNDYLQSLQSRIQPFSFLRIGQGNPPSSQPLPVPGAIPSNGQNLATGLGSAATAIGSAALSHYASQNNSNAAPAANNAGVLNEFYNGTTVIPPPPTTEGESTSF